MTRGYGNPCRRTGNRLTARYGRAVAVRGDSHLESKLVQTFTIRLAVEGPSISLARTLLMRLRWAQPKPRLNGDPTWRQEGEMCVLRCFWLVRSTAK